MIVSRTQVKYDATLHLSEMELRSLAFLSSFRAEEIVKILEGASMEFRPGGEAHGGMLSLLKRAREPASQQCQALNAAHAAFDSYIKTHPITEAKP